MDIDKIYIIAKKTHYNYIDLCKLQLQKHSLLNYIFIDAIYPKNIYRFESIYENIIKNMEPNLVKYNFTIGALGCLLSHIQAIKHAKENNYNKILVLEEDFIIHKDFINEYKKLINSISNSNLKYDFLYLGRKQGDNMYPNEKFEGINYYDNFIRIKEVNEFLYIPNYKTWATHALLIKNTVFDSIIDFETNIVAPYDILLMNLYSKYNFFCVKTDLFIADDSYSEIQPLEKIQNDSYNLWSWNKDLYQFFDTCYIKNIIIYGFSVSGHTHHYINKMYYDFFCYYYPNLNIMWVDKMPENIEFKESLILISPCHKKIDNQLPDEAFYIIC